MKVTFEPNKSYLFRYEDVPPGAIVQDADGAHLLKVDGDAKWLLVAELAHRESYYTSCNPRLATFPVIVVGTLKFEVASEQD